MVLDNVETLYAPVAAGWASAKPDTATIWPAYFRANDLLTKESSVVWDV